MDKEKISKVAKKIKLKVTDNILKALETEYDELEKRINSLKDIDTNNIEPLVRLGNNTSFLREDVEGFLLDKKVILDNAKNSDSDYVSIKKVVKNV